MVNVTDLVLAQEVFGRPLGSTDGGFGRADGTGPRNSIPDRAVETASNAMRGVALANALDQYPAETYDSAPSASPVMTAASHWLNQWGQREYDVYDPPPVAPLPFRRQYRSDAPPPADSAGRLTHDSEGRSLGARHIVGLTEVDGLNVGLRPEQVADVTRRLLGHDPARLPGFRMGRSLGRTRYDPPPLTVDIRSDLRPDLRRKVEAHELGHVIEYIAKFIPVDNHRAQLRSIYNTLNNPSRTRDGLDAAPGNPFIPQQRNNGYTGWWSDRELMAEAIRAYLVDPNYIKTVAPELAGAIRDAVNSNPILAPIIQFNNLRLPTHAGPASQSGLPPTGTT